MGRNGIPLCNPRAGMNRMNLSASDFYSHFRPSECDLRVFLRHHGETERTPNPYEEVLRRLGVRHEKGHLATFSGVVDVSSGTLEERARRTQEAVKEHAPVIYQGVIKASASLNGTEHTVVGEPDFLVLCGDGKYLIRDSKISKRINEKDHPEILRQMELYGWLYERAQGQRAVSLQVHSGPGDIVEVAYNGGTEAMEALRRIVVIKEMSSEPYCPVGWTKCGSCGFYGRCWSAAEDKKDIALIMGVDQSLSIALHDQGIETIEQLLAAFDEKRLAELNRPWGKKIQRVGERASAILRAARCLASGKEIILKTPDIPGRANYVMFDLEGLPPQLDELDKIYLWGVQVFGERPSPYFAATAGFGEDGERQGWESFLEKTKAIFEQYGDVPFVHWHHYERVWVDKYIERFGDRDGIAQRLRENLLNLLPVMQQSVIAPLPSYSLKVVEAYIGFRRTQEEYGGQWAMAKYIEATETNDEGLRAQVMNSILDYNREDLAATWAVLGWLRSKQV